MIEAGPGSRAKDVPSSAALKAVISNHLKNSHAFRQELMLSYTLRVVCKLDHTLLFTPPYYPSAQPIELTWGDVKCFVKNEWFPGRTLMQTHEQVILMLIKHNTYIFLQVLNAFYGGPSHHSSVGKRERTGIGEKAAKGVIRHSHDFINCQIPVVGVISGTVRDLNCPGSFVITVFSSDEESGQEFEHEENEDEM